MTKPWTRTASIALAIAAAWSVLLVAAAFVAPAYSTSSGSASMDTTSGATTTTEVTTGSATLVAVNGPGVLVVIALPLVVTLLVALSLATGHRRVGWVLTAILCLVNVLALLSVGIFFVPVTLALIVACASSERRRVAHPADGPDPLSA